MCGEGGLGWMEMGMCEVLRRGVKWMEVKWDGWWVLKIWGVG